MNSFTFFEEKKVLIILVMLFFIKYSNAQWTGISLPNSPSNVLFVNSYGNNIYVGTDYYGMYSSSDNGKDWKSPAYPLRIDSASYIVENNNGMQTYIDANLIGYYYPVTAAVKFKMESKDSVIIAGTWAGIYYSGNNGKTWIPVNNGLPQCYFDYNGGSNLNTFPVMSLCISNKCIFASIRGYGIYMSALKEVNDSLVLSWSTLGGLPSALNPVFPDNSNINIYSFVANGNNIFAGTAGFGVYEATYAENDTWSGWKNVSAGIPATNSDYCINSLLIANNTIFAGTNNGIYLSSITGDTLNWTAFNTGFPQGVIVTTLLSYGTYILAGTNFGIYTLSCNNITSWSPFYVDNNFITDPIDASTITSLAITEGGLFALYKNNPVLYKYTITTTTVFYNIPSNVIDYKHKY